MVIGRYFRKTPELSTGVRFMLSSLSRAGLLLAFFLSACCWSPSVWGQQMIWTDTFNGGVVIGAFSIGDQSSGIGMIENALPTGATIRHATMYAVSIGAQAGETLSFNMGAIPIQFGPSTAGPVFQSTYGAVVLHQVDLTALLNPATAMYTINLTGGSTSFKEFTLVTEYEMAGAAPVTVDIFHCGADSQLEENYAIHTSHPMSTDGPIAFGTMGAYATSWLYDYEAVLVNGVELGRFYGPDYNAGPGNHFGASATFHYAHGIFEGVGDDNPDEAIHASDVLTDLAGQVADGSQSFEVTYRHNPTMLPQQQADNIVNLIVLAYSAAPCDNATEFLGPDTTLCPGDTLVLDATRNGTTYLWGDGSTSPTFTVTAAGTYYVQWVHADCTYEPDTIVVAMPHSPFPALGPDRELCSGETIQLGVWATPFPGGEWNDGNTDMPRTVFLPGLYTFSVTDNGCLLADSILITLVECGFDVEMPNVFSPNNDGQNDRFIPLDYTGAEGVMEIYNRWGQLIFTSRNLAQGWSGQDAPAGTYYYIVAPDDPRGEKASGHVTLLR